jgi:molecular chaperone DnaK (HSP70)
MRSCSYADMLLLTNTPRATHVPDITHSHAGENVKASKSAFMHECLSCSVLVCMKVQVGFDIDANGILNVSAEDKTSGAA